MLVEVESATRSDDLTALTELVARCEGMGLGSRKEVLAAKEAIQQVTMLIPYTYPTRCACIALHLHARNALAHLI